MLTRVATGRSPFAGWLAGLVLLMAGEQLRAEEVSLQFNELTVNASLEMAAGKDFGDGMVLILHGLMGHNRMELVEASQRLLRDNGRSSLAINLSLGRDDRRGFFDCTWTHRHRQDNALDEISLWIDWLRGQGVRRIVLMAHSRGSNQAMVYAVDRLDPEISHVVLLAPGADDVKPAYEKRYGSVFDRTAKRMRERIALGRADEPVSQIDFWFCPKASVTPASFISYYGDDSRFRQFYHYLPRMPVPTLIITGTEDERFPNIGSQVRPYIDKQRLFLAEIEDAGHFFRDLNIDDAIDTMLDFLERES